MNNTQEIVLGDLHPSPTNPRKNFPKQGLTELASNLKTIGQIENLVVRMKTKGFEIVCGERRFRAAKLAKLESLICDVKELTDDQVLEIQISENLMREDVNAMDEAEAYHVFMKERKYTVAQLSERLGKSENYIRLRLKFTSLDKNWKKVLRAESMPMKAAEKISQLTKEKQDEAFDELMEDGVFKLSELNYFLENEVFIALDDADFDPTQTNLIPNTPACGQCPKKSDHMIGLFTDVAEGVHCLDSKCFMKKQCAFYKKQYANIVEDNPEVKDRLQLAGRNWQDLGRNSDDAYASLENLGGFYKNGTPDQVLTKTDMKSPAMLEAATPVMMIGLKRESGRSEFQVDWLWTIGWDAKQAIGEGKSVAGMSPKHKKASAVEKLEDLHGRKVAESFLEIGGESFSKAKLDFKMPRPFLELWAVNLVSDCDSNLSKKYIENSGWKKVFYDKSEYKENGYVTTTISVTAKELQENNSHFYMSHGNTLETVAALSNLELNKFIQHMLFGYFTKLYGFKQEDFFSRAGFKDKEIAQWQKDAELEHAEFLTKKTNAIEERFKKAAAAAKKEKEKAKKSAK